MSALDPSQIAFIICVNDEEVFEECQYYLERLALPNGIKRDIIAVREAPSMAVGYHAAMKSSNAKYKVYLHQDVFILNCNFIQDIIKIFEAECKIGILGCVGSTDIGKEAMAITSWNKGKVIQQCGQRLLSFDETQEDYESVIALDGMLMATQYDIPWREDIMDGWDFYDLSQCMEFLRKGYLCVVPRQENAWCYHDNRSSNLTKYHIYRERFIKEYKLEGKFEMAFTGKSDLEYEEVKKRMEQMIDMLFQLEEREQIYEIFRDKKTRKYIHVLEYGVIADIDYLEGQYGTEIRFWNLGMDISELFHKVRQLKYWMIRIGNRIFDAHKVMEKIFLNYSIYAISVIFNDFAINKDYTYRTIEQFMIQNSLSEELEKWKKLEF